MTKRVSDRERQRITRSLRRIMFDQFAPVEVMAVEQGLRNRNATHKETSQRISWSTVRVRNEVDTALTLLQRRHVDNKGKALSRSDLISMAVMEALPALVAKTSA